MCGWNVEPIPKIINNKKVFDYNFFEQSIAAATLPYLKKNIYYNFNILTPGKEYVPLKRMSKADENEIRARLREYGLPDVIFGYPTLLSLIFDKKDLENDYYELIEVVPSYLPWKDKIINYTTCVYARSGIYKEIMEKKMQREAGKAQRNAD